MQNDLISRSALLKDVEDWHDSLGGTMNPADWGIQNVLQSVMDYIIEAEDVDAVPVVRCRECWNRGNDLYCPMCHKEYFYDEDDGGDWELFDETEDDGFCPRGKKMDGGAEG